MAKKFAEGMFVKAIGVISGTAGKTYLANPHVEVADLAESGIFAQRPSTPQTKDLFAVYPESSGITSLWFRHAIEKLLASGVLNDIEDSLPHNVCEQYHLPDLHSALIWIHKPEKENQAKAARKRFAFEEIFTIQVMRAIERLDNDAQSSLQIKNGTAHVEKFLTTIHFPPTRAQHRAIIEILKDMQKPHPMARLLEGDVGSGKTLVAAAASYAVVNSRPAGQESGTLQVAYMAPTEILAMQHFQSFIEYFKDLPINIGLITGSGCKKFPSKIARDAATNISRAQLLKWVANGEIALLIGTHAIIQESVKFQNLALTIVDEQHRFGTAQRRALAQKNTRVVECAQNRQN
jgi:ATP-dependent DNA helicase RecG